MIPTTLMASRTFASLLTTDAALATQIAMLSSAAGLTVPAITADQVVLSSAAPDIGDKSIMLTYPRVCLYSSTLRNTLAEKFKSLSGTVSVVTEIWASGNLVSDTDQWIHFYVEAVTSIYRGNTGDLGNGLYFPGTFDVQFQPPKPGGIGFSQSAKVICVLNVSQD